MEFITATIQSIWTPLYHPCSRIRTLKDIHRARTTEWEARNEEMVPLVQLLLVRFHADLFAYQVRRCLRAIKLTPAPPHCFCALLHFWAEHHWPKFQALTPEAPLIALPTTAGQELLICEGPNPSQDKKRWVSFTPTTYYLAVPL